MRWAGMAATIACAGCESMVTRDLAFVVPDEVAAAYDRDAPGLLRSSEVADVAPVCGSEGFTAEIATEDFGCEPDDPEVTVEAWIVPVPASWDPSFCDLAAEEGGLVLDATLFPAADLPERSDADPSGATDTRWDGTPICGGDLVARVVLGLP